MHPNEKSALRAVAITVVADSLIIGSAAVLVVGGLFSTAVLAALGFLLFWANQMFFQARSHPTGTSWKSLALEATAGIYFSGAVWGVVTLARDRNWNQLFGPIIAGAIGALCLSRGRRLRVANEGRCGDSST